MEPHSCFVVFMLFEGLFVSDEANSKATSGRFFQLKGVAFLDVSLRNGIGCRIFIVVSVGRISIDGGCIGASFVEEVEFDGRQMAVGIALSTYKPVVGSLGFACHRDILCRFSLKIFRVIPVASHVANELECIVIFLIILGKVGCHLQWTVHGEV